MMKCDVLVVGAGASGSVASYMLSKLGYNVITVDRASAIGAFTNPKIDITESELPFGSGIRPIIKRLQLEPLKESNLSIWKSRNEVFTLESDVHDLCFKRGPTQDSLEYQLMTRAIDKGCHFLPSVEIQKFAFVDKNVEEVIVNKENEKLAIKPRIIVGADGSFSSSRTLLETKEQESFTLEGFGLLFRGENESRTSIIFDSEFARGGYIYHDSIGSESVIGVIVDCEVAEGSSKHYFDLNMSDNEFFKRIKNGAVIDYFSGSGRVGILEGLVKGNTILIGEAGLLVDPFLGYGLNYAIFSAYEAAKVVDEYLGGDSEALEKYEKTYQTKMLPHFKDALKLRKLFRTLDNGDFDFIVSSLRKVKEESNLLANLARVLRSKPTSVNALRVLYALSKIFYP